MSGDKKNLLVPRLRFHEFQKAWLLSPMSTMYSFKGNNSLSRDKLNYVGGSFRNIHYGDIHTKFAQHFRVDAEFVPFIDDGELHSAIRPENYCSPGDMVFADASEDMVDIGKAIEIIDAGDTPLVSGLHTILAKPNGEPFALGFGAYLFSSDAVRKQIQREAQGAKVLGLSANRLGNVNLPYPGEVEEQQKIADCLSSLDERIAVETSKLDTLKVHKQCLMQQLFPAEGEALPRLRFPEFLEAGEWEEKAVGDLGEVITGSTPSTKMPEYYGGEFPFISPADISDLCFIESTKSTLTALGFAQTRQIAVDSVLFVCIGSTIGKVARNRYKCATNQQINSIVPSSGNSGSFIYYLLAKESDRIAKLAGHHAVPIINKSTFASVKVFCPKKQEQEKISTFLSPLDDLITAQTQNIDLLKRHKNGLMQQLFPVLDEEPA